MRGRVLLAGATGYLGGYTALELLKRGYHLTAVARHPEKLKEKGIIAHRVLRGEVTRPETIQGCCEDIDVVISTIGITRQKDGLTYMDVDYQANKNLLHEAKRSGVRKFIYVSVLNGRKLMNLDICRAKELFVDQLISSELDYCIIRPNGFFSDMAEIFQMAKKGRVYFFRNGRLKANPIHGEDLAEVCVDSLEKKDSEIAVGGPETLTQNQIAQSAFQALGKTPKITYIPDVLRTMALKMIRAFTGRVTYGPIEFFLTVMAMEMVAPEYGRHTLDQYFKELAKEAR